MMLPKDVMPIDSHYGTVTLLNPDGSSKKLAVWAEDIVTTLGKNRAASHLANPNPGNEWITQLALGTNNDPESTEDPSLGAEIYKVDLSTVWAVGETIFGNKIIEANDIGVASYTIWEIGLLNVNNILIARQVFESSITFTGNEKLDFLWGVIIS